MRLSLSDEDDDVTSVHEEGHLCLSAMFLGDCRRFQSFGFFKRKVSPENISDATLSNISSDTLVVTNEMC
jgi:hypothetical protein